MECWWGEGGERRCPDLCECLGLRMTFSPVVVDAHLGASHPAAFLGIITRGTPLSIHILSTAHHPSSSHTMYDGPTRGGQYPAPVIRPNADSLQALVEDKAISDGPPLQTISTEVCPL